MENQINIEALREFNDKLSKALLGAKWIHMNHMPFSIFSSGPIRCSWCHLNLEDEGIMAALCSGKPNYPTVDEAIAAGRDLFWPDIKMSKTLENEKEFLWRALDKGFPQEQAQFLWDAFRGYDKGLLNRLEQMGHIRLELDGAQEAESSESAPPGIVVRIGK